MHWKVHCNNNYYYPNVIVSIPIRMVGQLYLQNWISSGVWILTLKCSETSSFCSCVISPTVICFGRWSRDALSRVHTLVVLGRGLLLTGVPRPLPLTIPLPRPFVGGSNNPRDFAWEKQVHNGLFSLWKDSCIGGQNTITQKHHLSHKYDYM